MTALAFNNSHACEPMQGHRKSLSQLSDADRLQEDWAQFIVNYFEDEKAAAKAFGVTIRTIYNWQKQDVPPRGTHVYRAIRRFGFQPNG